MTDFYALRNHAAEQGKDFECYLRELTHNTISLDTAIDNARRGINLKDYLVKRQRRAMVKITATVVAMAGLLALVAATSHPRDIPRNLNGGLFGGEYVAYCGFNSK